MPDVEITATVIPERSDAHYARAQWRLQPGSRRYAPALRAGDGAGFLRSAAHRAGKLVKRALRQGGERAASRVERLARGAGTS